MKKGAIARLVIWSILALVFTAALIIGMLANGRKNIATHSGEWFIGINGGTTYPDADDYTVYSETAHISDDISNINIDWVGGSISIEAYYGDTIKMEENLTEDTRYRLRYRVKNGTLDIQYMRSGLLLGFGKIPNKNLTVMIPSDMLNDMYNISIDTVSANVEMKMVSTENLDIDTTSGNITLESCVGNSLDFDSTSGDITAKSSNFKEVSSSTVSGKVNFSGNLERLEIETTSGDIAVSSLIMPKSFETDSISGNVELLIPENDGFTAEVNSVSGKFKSDFETRRDEDEYIYKNGSAEFQFDSVSGDVSILKLG